MTMLRTFLLALAGTALLASCSSTPAVSQSQVEDKISSGLEEQVGQKPDSVDCPGDLEGKVGASMDCTLTAGSDTLGVTVKVNEVDGDNVNFDFEVDDQVQ